MMNSDQDWVPAWSIGSIAGISGVMLTVLLFFLRETPVTAAPDTKAAVRTISVPEEVNYVEELQPTPAADVRPILSEFPDLSLPRPQLENSALVRTHLPFSWDQDELAVIESQARRHLDPAVQDAFHQTDPYRPAAETMRPYVLAESALPPAPEVISPLGWRTIFDGYAPQRDLGIVLRKQIRERASVGDPIAYVIEVSNGTQDPIDQIVVRETVQDMQMVVSTNPPAAVENGALVWSIGTLAGQQSRRLEVTVISQQAAEIETQTTAVNTTRVAGMARVESPTPQEPTLIEEIPEVAAPSAPVTPPEPVAPLLAPELKLSVSPMQTIQQGDVLSLRFTVSNVGTAEAVNVTLFVELSEEFKHRYGDRVQHTIARLAPGESREALFQARARELGAGRLFATLRDDGDSQIDQDWTIRVESAGQPPQATNKAAPVVECQRPETSSDELLSASQWRPTLRTATKFP